LGNDPARQAPWAARLHFGSGGRGGWRGTSIDAVLQAWASPINTVALPAATSAAGRGSGGSGGEDAWVSFPRLDGHYGWCLWPDEVATGTVVNACLDLCRHVAVAVSS
jgi:hypothetical protein